MGRAIKKSLLGLFLTFFGLPFIAGGAFVGWQCAQVVLRHESAKGWKERPAYITDVRPEEHSGDEGGSTAKVVCSYGYTWHDRHYNGTRVGIHDGADNIGSWQRDTYRRLKAARDAEKPIPCYVNPHHPEEAALDRSVRFLLLLLMSIFPATFVPVGAGLTTGGLIMLLSRRRKRDDAEASHDPDRPWLAKPDWAAGVIPASLGSTALLLVIIAVYWNSVWLPIYLYFPSELLRQHNALALFALIPMTIGLLLGIGARRAWLRRRRFGGTSLHLQTLPGVIGGEFRAMLVLPSGPYVPSAIKAELKCVESITESHGDSTARKTKLWAEKASIPVPQVPFGEHRVEVPLAFAIPSTCRPADETNDEHKVAWKLEIRGAEDDKVLKLEFDVPVYRTPESEHALTDQTGTDSRAFDLVVSAYEPPEKAPIRRWEERTGLQVFFIPHWPGIGIFLGFVFFASTFTAAPIVIWQTADAVGCFAIFGTVFGLLLWYSTLSFLGSTTLSISPERIDVDRRIGRMRRHRTIPAEQLAGIQFKQSSSSGSTVWYTIHASLTNGRTSTLIRIVKGEMTARWLVRQIETALAAQPAALPQPQEQ